MNTVSRHLAAARNRALRTRAVKPGLMGLVILLWATMVPAQGITVATAKGPETECRIVGRVEVRSTPDQPARVATGTVGRDCRITFTERAASAAEKQELIESSGPAAGPQVLAASVASRVQGRLRTEHVQIGMGQIDSYVTWNWNGSSVTGYSNGYVQTGTGGCGWTVTDGPHAWYETADMPYRIYTYGWAYFKSCSPTVNGYLEAAAWGDYAGDYGVVCDYDIVLPWGSSVQCFSTLIF